MHFYFIQLSHASVKYCSVATPFWGVYVYAWSALSLLGLEMALEELMCRVFDNLLVKCVAHQSC